MIYEASHATPRGIFRASVIENGAECYEEVWREAHGASERVHYAWFEKRLLGSACRDEYARVLASSIAEKWRREHGMA